MQRLSSLIVLATTLALASCSTKNLCPFPNATPVTVTPATPCIAAHVDTCIDPTLVVTNGCDGALYLPTAYGRFDNDAAQGADVEIVKGQTAHYVVRPEKATSVTDSRKEWKIPARVVNNAIEFSFATTP